MKINEQAEKALLEPDTKAIAIEMTEERKERFRQVSYQIIDILKSNTRGPVEAYSLLNFIKTSFEDCYGIRGGIVVNQGDTEKSA